jgi:hypothetical protein
MPHHQCEKKTRQHRHSDHATLCIEFQLSNEALLFKKTEKNKETDYYSKKLRKTKKLAPKLKSINSSSKTAREVNFRK